MDVSAIITIIGVITVLVNIITQVLKKVTWDKIPTNVVVLILSELLTLTGTFAYSDLYDVNMTWIMITGAIVIGFLVCFSAMFGYDKLIETLKGVKNGSSKRIQ